MSNFDYFETKVQDGFGKVVQCLVEEWKKLNPHEPDLQKDIESYGQEILAYVRTHAPIPKKCFTIDNSNKQDPIEIQFEISRYTVD
jgi:hypothetical protein